MAFEFRLPDIGEGVVEGEVVRWLVQVGDAVREDQPMVEVMTDKATVEIPSPKAGRIAAIEVPDGKIAKVGQVLVRIEVGAQAQEPAATKSDTKAATPPQPNAPVERVRAEAGAVILPMPGAHLGGPSHATGHADDGPVAHGGPTGVLASGKALATPATRKIARELGVDLSRVAPTGPNGRVTTSDVRAFASGGGRDHSAQSGAARSGSMAASGHASGFVSASAANIAPAATAPALATVDLAGDERVPFRGVRKKIAENMARSKRTAAHFTYVEEADLTELVQLRARAKKRAEERGIKLSFIPFIVKAVVAGLKKYPVINSTLDEDKGEIVLRKRYHIGVAAASQQGLIVPVVKDADKKSIFDLARELDDIATRAKEGRATRDELTGSTFTISSLGQLGGLLATPIINHPEVAILGVHKIKQAPVVRDGQIVIRDIGHFSISLDHRVVDGYEGAEFLAHVIALLSDPTMLFMELV